MLANVLGATWETNHHQIENERENERERDALVHRRPPQTPLHLILTLGVGLRLEQSLGLGLGLGPGLRLGQGLGPG